MSGIVGIVHLDGGQADPLLLKKMTAFMAYRGPDGITLRHDQNIGFGHAALDTGYQRQAGAPIADRHSVWVLADGRIDDQETLKLKLRPQGVDDLSQPSDAELILRAYQTWGTDCVNHLAGDFSFALWDKKKKQLVCARDHFGVKPFYFTCFQQTLLFSNTLNCLRTHTGVSGRINHRFVGDFLLFGFNQQPASTVFASIHRLPPAHMLTWSPDQSGPRIHQYWHLGPQKTLRLKKKPDYVRQFIQLMETAVQDRLRTNRACVFMSGGLDSTTVTATAKKILVKQARPFDLKACTFIYDKILDDKERYFSQLTADALGISVTHIHDGYNKTDFPLNQPNILSAEPQQAPIVPSVVNQIKRFAQQFRVGLTGQGGDPALFPSLSDFSLTKLVKHPERMRFFFDILIYRMNHDCFPRIGIRTYARRRLAKGVKPFETPYPPWLDKGFEKKYDLPGRWEELKQKRTDDEHRFEARSLLLSPLWTHLFESYDPGVTGCPIELRHPFFDLRMIRFLLSLPAVPWCADKEILRVAMEGCLPDAVLNRPKTPLPGYPVYEGLKKNLMNGSDDIPVHNGLNLYIDTTRFNHIKNHWNRLRPEEYELLTRPLGLAIWLDRQSGLTVGDF